MRAKVRIPRTNDPLEWQRFFTHQNIDNHSLGTTAPLQGGGKLANNLVLSILPATTSAAGSMSAADKTKLDSYDSFTAGSIPFGKATGGGLTQENSNLFWDNANDRLGIKKNNPSVTVDVSGIVAASDFIYCNNKIGLTPSGGIAIRLTNRTGSNSVKGEIVSASTSYDNAVMKAVISSDVPIGAMYEDGIADGSECWVAISGIVEVMLKDGTSSTRGNWVYVSNTAGRADATNTGPTGITEHTREIGHCWESKTSGTNVLTKIVMHFN